jgi:uncharacterized protein
MNDDVPAQSESSSFLKNIFVGNQGIRAGWSIGIFIILLSILTVTFTLPVHFLLEKNNMIEKSLMQPIQSGAGEFAAFLGLLGASMIMALIEHKPLISYGLEGRQQLPRFAYGFLSGMAALSALVLVLKLCGLILIDGPNIFGWEAIKYCFGWIVAFFLVGLYEEYFLRGYLQATLTRGVGFWWSALILSAAFGCIHIFNKGESAVGICSAALIGLVFCASLWYLKSLWWAIGFHASWDWTQSYLWGTADSGLFVQGHLYSANPQGNILWSGGSTGPEGSLMIIPLLIVIALLMWIVWGRKTNKQTNNMTQLLKSL